MTKMKQETEIEVTGLVTKNQTTIILSNE